MLRTFPPGTTGALAACKAGHLTAEHQHYLGAVNWLLTGQKTWVMRDPGRSAVIEFTQKAGDVVYIPPGWWHEVRTVMGFHDHDGTGPSVALSFATWVAPRAASPEACSLVRSLRDGVRERQLSANGEDLPPVLAPKSIDAIADLLHVTRVECLPIPTTTGYKHTAFR